MKLKDFLNIEENDSQIVTPDTISYIKHAICDFLSIYNHNYPTGIDFDKYYDTYQKQNIFDMTVA